MTLARSSFVHHSFSLALAIASTISLLAVACSSSDSDSKNSDSGGSGGSGNSGSSNVASSDDCARRCSAKFVTCGATADEGNTACSQNVCNSAVTTGQLSCLENKSCDQIANSPSFVSLCPASGSGTSNDAGASNSATCGKVTCKSEEYCSLAYDSQTQSWGSETCRKTPSACADKSGDDLCSCMQENAGCSTSGIVVTKCSQSDGVLTYGCN